MRRREFIQVGALTAGFAATRGLFAAERKTPGFTMRIDDNKSPRDWDRVATLFEKRGIRVSFAVVPSSLNDAQAACLKNLVARGHLLMDHTPNHHFYVVTYGDAEMFAKAKTLPFVHDFDENRKTVYFNPEINPALGPVRKVRVSIKDNVLTFLDKQTKPGMYAGFFQLPGRSEVFGLSRKSETLTVLDFWRRGLKEKLDIADVEASFCGELVLQPCEDLLREMAKVSRERFAHFGLPRPDIWVRPGGWCPGIDQDRIGKIYGGEFDYVGADSRPGKLPWGKGRWCTGYDKMHFFDQGANITPESLVDDIGRELQAGHYHVRLSHMWSHVLPGKAEEWYAKTERFADLVKERGFRCITMKEQYEERFGLS